MGGSRFSFKVGLCYCYCTARTILRAGRSLPNTSDGIIQQQRVHVNDQEWTVFSVGGSPAQTVLHGVIEVMKAKA